MSNFFQLFDNSFSAGLAELISACPEYSFRPKKSLKSLFFLICKLSGKFSVYCCQFLAPIFKSAGDAFDEKHTFREICISSWFLGIEQKAFCPCFSFFSELSNLHSTCQAKSFPKFFSNEITFFIFFGWTLSTKFVDVCQTLSGRTVRAAFFVSIGTKKRILYFFSKSFCFLSFSDNEQKKSVSASQILVFLSKMLSMCPEKPLEEEKCLIRKKYSFVHLGHWTRKFWSLSENLVRVCQSCILHSLWNFSRKSLKWTCFSFSDTLRRYFGVLPIKWQCRQKCNLRIQRNIWRVVFEEKVFSSFSDTEWTIFGLLKELLSQFSKLHSTCQKDRSG